MISDNKLFEYAEFGGNLYGTSKKAVEIIQRSGKICILDIDLRGVKSFKESNIDAKYILIRPPSIDALVFFNNKKYHKNFFNRKNVFVSVAQKLNSQLLSALILLEMIY